MSALEDLKKVIKEAVTGNKLSASRVEATKKASTRCFDRAHLVKSELLRIHTSAPAASKIVSLYLFDAIVRNAKEVIKRNGASYDAAKILPSTAKAADPNVAFVSAANEFLSEMSNIVLDVAIDTAKSVKPELREKVEKIIDIWRKAGAFDSTLLDQVEAAVKSASASTSTSTSNGRSRTSSHDPRTSNTSKDGSSSKGAQSTTPPTSPPPYLRQRFSQTQSMAAAQAPSTQAQSVTAALSDPTVGGLPPNLAALLGGQSSSHPLRTGPAAVTSNGTQDFMNSLNSLMKGSRQGGTAASSSIATAGPAFDLSQLTALQQSTSAPEPAPAAAYPPQQPQQQPQAVDSLQGKSVPPPPPPQSQPPPPPPPPAPSNSAATAWPPAPSESAGDLSTFDVTAFNPTDPPQWTGLAQRWANTYGYMPGIIELGMNYLMFYQAALMSNAAMATGGQNGMAQQDQGANASGGAWDMNDFDQQQQPQQPQW